MNLYRLSLCWYDKLHSVHSWNQIKKIDQCVEIKASIGLKKIKGDNSDVPR